MTSLYLQMPHNVPYTHGCPCDECIHWSFKHAVPAVQESFQPVSKVAHPIPYIICIVRPFSYHEPFFTVQISFEACKRFLLSCDDTQLNGISLHMVVDFLVLVNVGIYVYSF